MWRLCQSQWPGNVAHLQYTTEIPCCQVAILNPIPLMPNPPLESRAISRSNWLRTHMIPVERKSINDIAASPLNNQRRKRFMRKLYRAPVDQSQQIFNLLNHRPISKGSPGRNQTHQARTNRQPVTSFEPMPLFGIARVTTKMTLHFTPHKSKLLSKTRNESRSHTIRFARKQITQA